MASAEHLNHAKVLLGKAEEYLASAGDAIHALISAEVDVEYGTALLTATKAEPLVRRAPLLVELAVRIVGLGG